MSRKSGLSTRQKRPRHNTGDGNADARLAAQHSSPQTSSEIFDLDPSQEETVPAEDEGTALRFDEEDDAAAPRHFSSTSDDLERPSLP
jgi:hypothetical protein